jgi:hypothetical protein
MLMFIDTETLGLHPDRHPIWEAAACMYDETTGQVFSWHSWQVQLTESDLMTADPVALGINKFHDRYDPAHATTPDAFCWQLAHAASQTGASQIVWAGAVPSFDEERIRRMFEVHSVPVFWHYHLLDVETLAIGHIEATTGVRLDLPVSSDLLTEMLDLNAPPTENRHTALGDVEWALAMYEACRPTGSDES